MQALVETLGFTNINHLIYFLITFPTFLGVVIFTLRSKETVFAISLGMWHLCTMLMAIYKV